MPQRTIIEAEQIQDWRHELSQSFAQANCNQFLQTSTDVREMWHGGGQLFPGQSGPGIKADRFRTEADRRFFDIGFDRDDGRRLRLYRKLFVDAANGVDPEILTKKLLQIYTRFSEYLRQGGFLVEARIESVRRACAEELGQWDMVVASL